MAKKQKTEQPRPADDEISEFRAQWRFARISARKARLLTDLIQNRQLDQATNLLRFSKKRAAVMVGKVLKSAAANADEKEADMRELYVKESFCDDGPIIKRMQPKDRGKSYTIFKRTCHITVVLGSGENPKAKVKAKGSNNRKAAKAA